MDCLDKLAGWLAVPTDLPVSTPLHPAQGFTSMYHHAQNMDSVDGTQILRWALLHSERLSMDTALSPQPDGTEGALSGFMKYLA